MRKEVWSRTASGARFHIDSYKYKVTSVKRINQTRLPTGGLLYRYRLNYSER